MERIDVILTWPLWEALCYESEVKIPEGSRVRVPVGKSNSKRVGFVLGESHQELADDIEIKQVNEIIDSQRILDPDIWDMALWAGRVCMCGAGEVLKLVLPKNFLSGEKLEAPPDCNSESSQNFREEHCFNPFDSERVNFYLDALSRPGRSLMLLPTHERAKSFFANLPESLKSDAILWPSSVGNNGKKLWEAWKLALSKQVRIIIAAPNGIFAPLSPERFIVEDEANPSYVIPYKLNLSARSIAGYRAQILGSEFITGGSLPSLKTFSRVNISQNVKPERNNIIIADMNHSRSHKEESRGIKHKMILTRSLIKRTYKALADNQNVIWILNRLGDASEVFCGNCGESIRCPKCNNLMRSESEGRILRCRVCGHAADMPDKCDKCGFDLLSGKRPGLEALFEIAKKYYNDVHIYEAKSSINDMHGLILSTERGLELCRKVNTSLIAWLDLDSELSWPEYNTRFRVFANLWESYWSGRERDSNSERKILIQARKSGRIFAGSLSQGWEKFFPDELRIREEYLLPPYGLMIEISCRDKNLREDVINILDSKGLFVMDPGGDSEKLYVNTKSLDLVHSALESFYSVRSRNIKRPDILIRSE